MMTDRLHCLQLRTQLFLIALVFSHIVLLPGCEQQVLRRLEAAPDADAELITADAQVEGAIERRSGRFRELVEQSSGLVILDFWGPHCPPCRQLAPELEKVVLGNSATVSVVKVDVEIAQNGPLASYFGIRKLPQMFLFKDGEPIGSLRGFKTASQILDQLVQ